MGGTKNREEKKKKAHVYSSGGGGGGTKGPSVIDKRNQEEQCPHCERIFKQKDRLKQHIQKAHAEEVEAAAAAASETGDGASGSGAQKQPEKARMEVGSRAGYYTEKSPKVFLHEYCLKEKRPTPRYRPQEVKGSGGVVCKVVLPDPKKSEKDIVVFLPDSRAAKTTEEAQQRAAVAALHRVQGDRALERVLPKDYRAMWEELGLEAQQRAAAAAAREAAAERRKEADKRRRDSEARKAPTVVIMSDSTRLMVEEALRSSRAQEGHFSESAMYPTGEEEAEGADDEVVAELTTKLAGLGFRAEDVQRSVEELAGEIDLDVHLDWLCLAVPDEHLPARYKHSVESKPIGVRNVAGAVKAAAADQGSQAEGEGAAEEDDTAEVADPAVRRVMSFGYEAGAAAAALHGEGGDWEAAVAVLFSSMLEESGGGAKVVGGGSPGEEWEEERVALEAIFGEQACTFPSQRLTRIDVPLEDVAVAGVNGPAVLLAWGGEGYPQRLPVLAVSCAGLRRKQLLALTRRLIDSAQSLLGGPLLFELAAGLPEAMAEVAAELGTPRAAPASAAKDVVVENCRPPEHVAANDQGATARPASAPRRGGRGRGRPRGRPAPSAAEVQRESELLLTEWRAWQESGAPQAVRMRRARKSLPAADQRGEVLQAATEAQVMVISGATGCGKSTQVPQFLLEAQVSAGTGGACNIICTQPRRISAVGLATRVAAERGETVGASVGYRVRLESRCSHRTRLVFCTIGILLRQMLGEPELGGVSHVVVDEVHERSIESDLLLLLLRQLVARRRDLRVVLMSATADATLFANYFRQDGASVSLVNIPGFTYPVRELYLEDVLERTGFVVGQSSKWAKKKGRGSSGGPGGGPGSEEPSTVPPVSGHGASGAGKKEVADDWEDALDDAEEEEEESNGGSSGAAAPPPDAASDIPLSELTLRSLRNVEEACVNYDLLAATVAHVVSEEARHGGDALLEGWDGGTGTGAPSAPDSGGGGGAVLIFLPGAPEISRCQRTLESSPQLTAACQAAGCQLRILPLHGSLPTAQQSRVFERVPAGVRKIVLATNVAETSITIDDVTCVIDTGRVKEMGFNPLVGMCQLKEEWVSQAAAQQRRGRAGRVQRGVCIRTFSRSTWGRMNTYQAPEILRMPLQGLCMQVRSILGPASGRRRLQEVLAQAITPPDGAALAQAIETLQSVQAFDADEELTALGRHLAQLPLDVHIGKMLIFSVLLRCLDPCLTIAAALGLGRSVWLSPPDRRSEANAARQVIAQAAGGAAKSDHILIVAAYNMWRKARQAGGAQAAYTFATDHFLSSQVLDNLHASRRDLAANLADIGLVPAAYMRTFASGSADRGGAYASANAASGSANIVKAALCAGAYPNVLRVEHPATKYKAVEAGAIEKDASPQQLRFFDRTRGRVFLHPSSANFSCARFETNWMVFTEMVETSKVFVRDSSMVSAFAMLLFGGQLKVHHEEGVVKLDDWAVFKVPAKVAVLVRELRAEVATLLSRKMEDVTLDLGASAVANAMHHLLTTDGF